MAVEVALAIVLLVGGALCAGSFVKLLSVDAGFDAANVLVADIHVPEGSRATRGEELAVAALERLREVPRVVAAGAGNMTPHGGRLYSSGFRLPGMATPDGEPLVATALHSVITPGFAEALNMRLAAGRFLAIEDTTAPIIAMLVNKAFVDAYFNDGRRAVGRRFSGMFPGMLGRDDAVVEVVGVVENVLLRSPDRAPQPQIYVPHGVGFAIRHATLVVRTNGEPATSAPLLIGIVQQLDPVATLGQVDSPPFCKQILSCFVGSQPTGSIHRPGHLTAPSQPRGWRGLETAPRGDGVAKGPRFARSAFTTARSAAAVNPLRGSSAALRSCG